MYATLDMKDFASAGLDDYGIRLKENQQLGTA